MNFLAHLRFLICSALVRADDDNTSTPQNTMPEKTKSTKSKKATASSPVTKKVTKQLPFRSKETITTSDEESSEDEQSEGADAAESPESESGSSESEEPAPVKAKKSAQEATTT